jgi:hypothetical protein
MKEEDASNINKEGVNQSPTLEQVVLGSIPDFGLTSETFSNRNNDHIKNSDRNRQEIISLRAAEFRRSSRRGGSHWSNKRPRELPQTSPFIPTTTSALRRPRHTFSFVPPGTPTAQHVVLCSKPRRGLFHGVDSPIRRPGQLLDNRASPDREPHASQRPDPANSQAQCLCHQCYPYRLAGCMGCSPARGARGRRA